MSKTGFMGANELAVSIIGFATCYKAVSEELSYLLIRQLNGSTK